MSSRRYLKRVWRVPKDRGPAEYLGTAIKKALRKHGWPAELSLHVDPWSFQIVHFETGHEASEDFWDAVEMAARIAFKTYRVKATCLYGFCTFNAPYVVTTGGHFKEMKDA